MENEYLTLNRSELSPEELLESRFSMQHWRHHRARQLLSEEHNPLPALLEMNLQLQPRLLQSFLKKTHGAKSSQAQKFFHQQGIHFGAAPAPQPQTLLPILPLTASAWPFQRWMEKEEFSRYLLEDEGVRFQGRLLLPGDILVQSQNTASDGVLACKTLPRRYLAHASYFVILKKKGKPFPAVLEIHEQGLRANPLNVELHRQKNSYVEIYRLKQRPQGFSDQMNKIAWEMLHENHPYDLYISNHDPIHLTCTRVGAELYRRSGIDPWPANSYVNWLGERNAASLGLELKTLLTPLDIVRDPRFQLSAVFDFDDFEESVCRELLAYQAGSQFCHGLIQLKHLPWKFHFYRRLVQEIQKGSWLGRMLLKVQGFKTDNFPHGPAAFIALMRPLGEAVEKALAKSRPLILSKLKEKNQDFSLLNFAQDPEIQHLLEGNTAQIRSWFTPADEVRLQNDSKLYCRRMDQVSQ